MKKYWIFILLLLVFPIFIGCGGGEDSDSPQPPPAPPQVPGGEGEGSYTLDLQINSLTAAASGDVFNIGVYTNSPSWNAVCDENWCMVVKQDGKINLTVASNNDVAERTCQVVVTATGVPGSQILIIRQLGVDSNEPFFHIELQSPYTISHVGTESMEAYVFVNTNVTGWTCRSDQSWCTVRCDDHNLYFMIPAYYGYDDRQVTITVSYEGVDYASLVIIQQADPVFTFVFPNGQAMPAQGGDIIVEVYTNAGDWEVFVPGGSWLTATKTSDTTIQLTAPARQTATLRPDEYVYVNATRGSAMFVVKDAASGNEGYGYDGDNTGWD